MLEPVRLGGKYKTRRRRQPWVVGRLDVGL